MPASDTSAPLLALGRIPTGLYVVTAREGGESLGFVASFLMQVGFQPPSLCVAIAKERAHLPRIRAAGLFGVSILDARSEGLMGRFFRKHPPGSSPFDGLAVESASGGTPVLAESLAWLECRLSGEHDVGDHAVVFGEVVDGKLLRSDDPLIHLRKSGAIY